MTDKELNEKVKKIDKEAMIERALGRDDNAKILEACSYSLRREQKDRKDKNTNTVVMI